MRYRNNDKRTSSKLTSRLYYILTSKASLMFFVIISIFFIFSEKINFELRSIFSESLLNIMSPIMSTTNNLSHYSKDMVGSVTEIVDLKKKNIILKQDNELLKLYYQKARDLEAENIQLRKLLNFVGQLGYKYVSARIISVNNGPFSKIAVLNIGKKQNIVKGQVVIDNNGLVGRIVEVADHTSFVLLITDLKSRIPVMTFNSKQRAILSGNNNHKMSLSYLNAPHRTIKGDLIVTSEDGGYFPPGIPIGLVEKKSDKEISVTPIVDLPNIDYVSVVIAK